MSYIHEALKRSQVQRQKARAASEASAPVQYISNTDSKRGGIVKSVVVLLATSLLAAALFWFYPRQNKVPAVQPVANPASASTQSSQQPAGSNMTVASHASSINHSTVFADLPYLWELSDSLKARLGDLRVNIHVYADNPAQRFLYLNNREYRTGEQTPEGVKVVRIEPQGAVLSYADKIFRLPRPR